MKTRKPIAILAATAVAGLGLTALASPASAEPSVQINGKFNSEPSALPNSVEGSAVTVTVVQTFGSYLLLKSEFLSLNGNECVPTDLDNEDSNPCSLNPTSSPTATFSILPGANSETVTLINNSGGTIDTSFTVTSTVQPGPDPDPDLESTSSSAPAPRIQQFEMPATGTCDEAQPGGLNWGGASSGGWGESWAQWMHEGQGGAVCTRTLAYNTSTGTWHVQ